ncbi:hypothetical protein HY837_05020 [archaeon]|nr:hypothetical protein [archaeon]
MNQKSYKDLGEIIELDLEQVDLLGFQEEVVEEVVNSIIKGIKQGGNFPPVFVTKVDEKTYTINCKQDPSDDSNRGGHHRALAHYKTKTRLKCLITAYNPAENLSRFSIHIKDCKLKKDPEWYKLIKLEDKRYR